MIIHEIVTEMDSLKNRYINKHMCSKVCPCAKVNSTLWGDRASELSTRNFNGSYSTFDSCYSNMTSNGVIPKLSEDLLSLVKYMESSLDCLGLCKPPLFYFYKDISK